MFGVTGEKRIKTPRSLSVVSYHHRTLSQDVSTQILEACERRGERFNEVAIALLMQTIADWNVRHGRSKPKHRLRILVPTDLRTLRDKTLPAANRFSFAFVGTHIWETADWTTVHGLTHKHMEIIRSLRLGVDFVDILGLLQSIPFISRIARQTLRIPLPMGFENGRMRCTFVTITPRLGPFGCPRSTGVRRRRLFTAPSPTG